MTGVQTCALPIWRPELVKGFIIGNTWAWPHDHDPRIRAFSWIMGGPIGKALTRSFNFVPRFFFSRGFVRPIDRDVLDAYLAPWSDRSRRGLEGKAFFPALTRRNRTPGTSPTVQGGGPLALPLCCRRIFRTQAGGPASSVTLK